MRKLITAAIAACALALAGTAGAVLVPGVYDPGNTGCPKASFKHGVLHLEKNCPTATNASAFGDITGLTGQPFASASFTLASKSQCQGGSPRFNIFTTAGPQAYFLGCNNVTPVINADGTATYNFTLADLVRINSTLPPPGTITDAAVIIDVQGTADVSKISVNGVRQVPAKKHGGGNDQGGNDNEGDHHAKGDHGHHGGGGDHGDKHGPPNRQGGEHSGQHTD